VGKIFAFIDRFNGALSRLASWLLVALVLTLAYEVASRYLFGRPTLWSYDLSYMLTSAALVLSMAHVLQRNEHVRVDILPHLLPPRWAAALEALLYVFLLLPFFYLLLSVMPGHVLYSWQVKERYTAGTWLPPIYPFKTWVLLGMVLLALEALVQFARTLRSALKRADGTTGLRVGAFSSPLFAVLSLGLTFLTFLGPVLVWRVGEKLSPEALVGCILASVIGAILLGFPIAFALAGVASLYGYLLVGPFVGNIFMLRLFQVFQDYILIAIPLFVFMGVVIERAGLADRLYKTAVDWVGRRRGGLAIATIVAATIFAAATGVVGASVVAIGLLALPQMLKYGYGKPLSTGVICAGGALGILIPPSIMLVVYGPTAGVSVGALFLAAIPAGLLLSALYILYVWLYAHLRPGEAPVYLGEIPPFKEKLKEAVVSVLPVALLILAVLGSIFFGLAAPTEAAAVGAFGSLVLATLYRNLSLRILWEITYQAARVSAMVYLVLIGAGFLSAIFVRVQGGDAVARLIGGLDLSPGLVLLVMLLIVFVLGMFVDWIGIVMITVPLFMPVAKAFGWDPLWFSMLLIVTMQTSFLTPPFAYTIFYLKGIAPPEVTTWDIYRGVVPFILLQLLGVLFIYLFPGIVTELPRRFGLGG
jgi:tripartite ATP-independent transporter DctM subunit